MLAPETWTVYRNWQGRAFAFFFLFTVAIGAVGVYALRVSPALGFSSGFWFSLSEPEIRRMDEFELASTLSLALPEFAQVEAEARWWRAQEQLFEHLRLRSSVSVTMVDASGRLHTESARIGSLPFFDILKRTWLIYFTVAVYLGSALSVFRRHRSPAGSILSFFLLACALYFISAAPVVARSLTLRPFLFKFFIDVLYAAAASLTTLVHFALVFPAPKQLVLRHRWIIYLPYATTVLVATLYLSGLTAFGATFPVLILGVSLVIVAFFHSLLQERDPFLRRQIRLSLTAPVLVSLFFICFYITPGVLRLPPIDFRYVALCFLVLPFALPLAMDNLALYGARLEVERVAQQEKDHIRADLHDVILNNLAVISRSSEVAQTCLAEQGTGATQRLANIRDLATATSRQLREFLWVLDDRHSDWEMFSSQLRQWGLELLEEVGCDLELNVAPFLLKLAPPPVQLRICLDRVYKEALHNVVKHARATHVDVSLHCRGGTLVCAIQDDGVGFDPTVETNGHYGLRNMARRVESVGGRMLITRRPSQGMQLTIELPLA